jgi:hypothetical protein
MFALLFDSDAKVMLAQYGGVLSSVDLSAVDRFVASFVAREGYVRSIYDLAAIEALAIPRSRLLERGRKLRMNPGQDRVFVVPQEDIYELYRDYAQEQVALGNGTMVLVRTRQEALRVLGLENPNFEPLVQGIPAAR